MKSPGGFIASWALGTCPQKCRVSLFGLSTLHGKSVPWHQDKTPHDVHESRVKRDRVLCFFVVLVIYRWMFFLNIYIYMVPPKDLPVLVFYSILYNIYYIYIYICYQVFGTCLEEHCTKGHLTGSICCSPKAKPFVFANL